MLSLLLFLSLNTDRLKRLDIVAAVTTINLDSNGISLINLSGVFETYNFVGIPIAVYGTESYDLFAFSIVDGNPSAYRIAAKCISGNVNIPTKVVVVVAK